MDVGAPWCTFVINLKITVQTGATIAVDWCSLEHVGAVWFDVDWSSLVPHVADWCMFHATRCTLV